MDMYNSFTRIYYIYIGFWSLNIYNDIYKTIHSKWDANENKEINIPEAGVYLLSFANMEAVTVNA